jgi:uncharacterized protein YecE (DUF72 family)
VNSTTYAIPQQKSVQEWVHATPSNFIFHFKAFGALCGSEVDLRQIPLTIRQKYQLPSTGRFHRMQHPEAYADLWSSFNESLEPMILAQKMGVVLFQFHTTFSPNETSREYVEECAHLLRKDVKMAVEFRDRNWIGWSNSLVDDCHLYENRLQLHETLTWLRSLRTMDTGTGPGTGTGVVLVASDELFVETFPNSSLPISLHPSATSITGPATLDPLPVPNSGNTPQLPIFLSSQPTNNFLYIRIHRREGKERLLSEEEIRRWVLRIESVRTDLVTEDTSADSSVPSTAGCNCYFLWGTDFEDQPLLNMKHLNELLPLKYHHQKVVTCGGGVGTSGRSGGIQSFFKKRKCDEKASGEEDLTRARLLLPSHEDNAERSLSHLAHDDNQRENSLSDLLEAPKKKTIRSYFVRK